MFGILRPDTGQYVSLNDGKLMWSNSENAHWFQTRQKAENFLRHNLRNNTSRFQVVGEAGTIRCNVTRQQAADYKAELSSVLSTVYQIGDIVSHLMTYHLSQIQKADLAMEDLLHKIEFTNAGAADGYKYYKAVQELRKKRRQHKDVYEELLKVNQSGISDSVAKLKSALPNSEMQKCRKYSARVSPTLFDENATKGLGEILHELTEQVATV